MGPASWTFYMWILVGLLLVSLKSFSFGDTDIRDVIATNALFISLGYPPLRGWILVGGDPCGEKWQGIECVFSNITAIQLSGLNLGGELGNNLALFESIISIDLSNNHIGGNIPSILPTTLRNFSLSINQFTGSIPAALSSLTQLVDLSLNDNLLTGVIPDAFQQLNGLNNLDLSGNRLSGQLPPSVAALFFLTTLHLQNNQLSGMLDVLQDLPLFDLNIENNLFSGPIPAKLLNIPNFRKDGNPFNTTIIPSAPTLAPSPFAVAPITMEKPDKLANGPTTSETAKSDGARSFITAKRVTWIAIIGAIILVALLFCLIMSICLKRNKRREDTKMVHDGADMASKYKPKSRQSSPKMNNDIEKAQKESVLKPRLHDRQETDGKRQGTFSMTSNNKDHGKGIIDVSTNSLTAPRPPAPLPLLSTEEIIKPIAAAEISSKLPARKLNSSSLKVFTVASLQQYTNSFSEDNLLGTGMLGSVYRAELPDGRLLAVKKLASTALMQQSDDEFHDLVTNICKFRHDNILELVGYCVEHGQRLLIYKYCKNGTLYDALHVDEEIHQKLSWNLRIKIALQAARALEYLHEACQPPIMHQNFKSANILLDSELNVHISDSGLTSLLLSGSANQLSVRHLMANGYSPPEFESGTYTYQSDIYSFGVVMLELLTGRKSCDRSRPRGEQFLVRWAVPRLHDIDALSRMVDPSLNGLYPIKSLSRFADIVSACILREPEFRPPISEIVQELLQML